MVFAVLAWIPGGFSRFVFAKLLVVALALVVGTLGVRAGALPRRIWLALGGGAAAFVLAALAGETPIASLIGRWPRYEGLPVLGLYVASAWLGARLAGSAARQLETLIGALAAMTWVLLAFSLLDAVGVTPLGASTAVRTGSVLGNATDQGLVAMMSALVLAAAWLRGRRSYHAAATVAALAVIGLSGSRTSFALVVIGLLALAAATVGRERRGRALTAVGVALLALAAAALAVPTTRDRLASLTTVDGRLLQWQVSWRMVLDHPLLGVGPSQYVDAIGRYETPRWVHWAGARIFADSPHDWLLQLLVAGGIPLLLSGLALAWQVLRLGQQAIRLAPEKVGLFAAVIAYGVAMLGNFTIAGSTCLAAFLAGALLGLPAGSAAEPTWRRAALVALGTVAVAGLMLACISEVRLGAGMRAAAAGDTAAARHDFDSARHLRPLDGDVAMLASEQLAVLASNGDHAAAAPAEDAARASLRRTPSTYAAQVALGVALLAQDRLPEARQALDAAVAAFPRRPDAYLQRGIARYGLGDTAGALVDVRHARRLDPTAPAPRRVLREIRRH